MRYIDRQLEVSACVPIAITNALIWAGRKVAFRELRETFVELGWNPKIGSTNREIQVMLEHFGFGIIQVENPSVRDIERYLDNGRSVLLAYTWFMPKDRPLRKSKSHLVFIDGHEGLFLGIKNVNGNGAEYKPRLQAYMDLINRRNYRSLMPIAWLLEKP
jgi:hypothetical protein